jgi:uncharacterized membrane protein
MPSPRKTQAVVLTALFVTLGLIIPYVTGHGFGIPGTILLPMHIPILLCGLLFGARLGALCGLMTPLLSSLLTGMPTMYPMLPIMMLQLTTMGLVSGTVYRRFRIPLYPALLLTMAAGWAVYGLTFSGMLLGAAELRAPSMLTAIATGIPGIVLQLLIIPPILLALKKYRLIPTDVIATSPVIEPCVTAKERITRGSCSYAILREGSIVHQGAGQGVAPLLHLYLEQPEQFSGALVVDKVIGKAAAMLLVLGGVTGVHGMTMSVAAKDYLIAHDITVSYDRLIDVIANRSRDGICPMERSVLGLDDPAEGLVRMQETLTRLTSAKSGA